MTIVPWRSTVIGVDPGRDKCGWAVVRQTAKIEKPTVLKSGISSPTEIGSVVKSVLDAITDISMVVVGNGTNSRGVVNAIRDACGAVSIEVVSEYGTSQAARSEYIARTCAIGLQKLLPKSLRSPNKPYDDVVAEIIARNFLESQ